MSDEYERGVADGIRLDADRIAALEAQLGEHEDALRKAGIENAIVATRALALEQALRRVNAIRNSIVGYQNVNWSAHIYPLVEALDDVGFTGMGHEKAAALAKTTIGLYEKMLAVFDAAVTDAQNTASAAQPAEGENE